MQSCYRSDSFLLLLSVVVVCNAQKWLTTTQYFDTSCASSVTAFIATSSAFQNVTCRVFDIGVYGKFSCFNGVVRQYTCGADSSCTTCTVTALSTGCVDGVITKCIEDEELPSFPKLQYNYLFEPDSNCDYNRLYGFEAYSTDVCWVGATNNSNTQYTCIGQAATRRTCNTDCLACTTDVTYNVGECVKGQRSETMVTCSLLLPPVVTTGTTGIITTGTTGTTGVATTGVATTGAAGVDSFAAVTAPFVALQVAVLVMHFL